MSDSGLEKRFEGLIEEHSDMVTRICILMLGNMIDAQDAYLSSFEKLFIALKKGREPEDIKRWLAKVAYNECRSMLRFMFRHKTQSLEDIKVPFKRQEELEFIELLYTLNAKYRNVLYLYYNEGYTTAEIAAMTSQREGTVRSQLKRARDKLRAAAEKIDKKGECSDETLNEADR